MPFGANAGEPHLIAKWLKKVFMQEGIKFRASGERVKVMPFGANAQGAFGGKMVEEVA